MSVDLGDFVDSLKREVSVPGEEETTFPDATDDSWVGNLLDAFWDARLDGLLAGYTADEDGLVTPTDTSAADIPRDLVQLIVLYSGIRIVRNHLRSIKTSFRAQAGPVSFETQQSATVLRDLLTELRNKRDLVLLRLSDLGFVDTYYIDAVRQRDENITFGDDWYPTAGHRDWNGGRGWSWGL